MTDPNTKAAKTAAALRKVASELRAEGNVSLAARLEQGVREMPVGSLAKLHDLIESSPTKAEALATIQ